MLYCKFCSELGKRYQKRACASKSNSESDIKYIYIYIQYHLVEGSGNKINS